MGIQIETVKTETFSMDFFRFGQGEKILVILPGVSVQSVMAFASFVARDYKILADDYTIYVFDRRKNLPDSYPICEMARDTLEALKVLNLAPVSLFGASQGGMIAQYYIDQHPARAAGFISVDSVPFGDYYSKSDMFWLSQLEWMCRMFPDKLLRSSMAKMCGATETARKRMFTMLSSYTKNELCHLMYVGEAAFIPENKKLDIPCRTILLLGDKDKVGKVAAYNKEWSRRTGFPLILIQGAAHNANDDQPDIVNGIVLDFIKQLIDKTK